MGCYSCWQWPLGTATLLKARLGTGDRDGDPRLCCICTHSAGLAWALAVSLCLGPDAASVNLLYVGQVPQGDNAVGREREGEGPLQAPPLQPLRTELRGKGQLTAELGCPIPPLAPSLLVSQKLGGTPAPGFSGLRTWTVSHGGLSQVPTGGCGPGTAQPP